MMVFPAYRKYKNNKSFFKILSPSVFEEVQLIGKKLVFRTTEEKQYPEKLFIQDMLFNFEERWDEIGAEEFERAAQGRSVE